MIKIEKTLFSILIISFIQAFLESLTGELHKSFREAPFMSQSPLATHI